MFLEHRAEHLRLRVLCGPYCMALEKGSYRAPLLDQVGCRGGRP